VLSSRNDYDTRFFSSSFWIDFFFFNGRVYIACRRARSLNIYGRIDCWESAKHRRIRANDSNTPHVYCKSERYYVINNVASCSLHFSKIWRTYTVLVNATTKCTRVRYDIYHVSRFTIDPETAKRNTSAFRTCICQTFTERIIRSVNIINKREFRLFYEHEIAIQMPFAQGVSRCYCTRGVFFPDDYGTIRRNFDRKKRFVQNHRREIVNFRHSLENRFFSHLKMIF